MEQPPEAPQVAMEIDKQEVNEGPRPMHIDRLLNKDGQESWRELAHELNKSFCTPKSILVAPPAQAQQPYDAALVVQGTGHLQDEKEQRRTSCSRNPRPRQFAGLCTHFRISASGLHSTTACAVSPSAP